jgi:UDP-N-acetylglucosamine 2-epimerase (non-hydrolysing)
MVSKVAILHLAPDANAAANLSGVDGVVVDTGGNTLRDALVTALERLSAEDVVPGGGCHVLVSIHRSENLSSRRVFDQLMRVVVETSKVLPIRFVLHPVTRRQLMRSGWRARLEAESNITLMERIDYPGFVRLMLGSRFLMTDGGSNQEEAAMIGLPTLLLRTATERFDGLDSGRVVLSQLNDEIIRNFVKKHSSATWSALNVTSDTRPSARIVDALA